MPKIVSGHSTLIGSIIVLLEGIMGVRNVGPIFLYLDKRSETVVRQRIKNLSDYLASLQVGQRPRGHETL